MITASSSSSLRAGERQRARARPTRRAAAVAPRAAPGRVRALKSWSCLSRLMARRPAEESTSVSVESCSPPDLEKNLLAAVFTIASSSPTLTMAEAGR